MNLATETTQYSHLAPNVREAAFLSNAERQKLIQQERWIGYTRANEAMAELERLFNYPHRGRMPNMLIFGPTNNGKSRIINRFLTLHQPYLRNSGELRITPIVLAELPPRPSITRLYACILESVGAPFRESDRLEKLEPLVMRILRQVGTRIIFIDELQNLMACNALQQRIMLNQLKYLGNQLKIPIAGAGTEEAWNAIKSDPQMLNRFRPFPLPVWEEGDELQQLLMTFAMALPLRQPSVLADRKIEKQILAHTTGTIGGITQLLEMAALDAIETGVEKITLEGIVKVQKRLQN